MAVESKRVIVHSKMLVIEYCNPQVCSTYFSQQLQRKCFISTVNAFCFFRAHSYWLSNKYKKYNLKNFSKKEATSKFGIEMASFYCFSDCCGHRIQFCAKCYVENYTLRFFVYIRAIGVKLNFGFKIFTVLFFFYIKTNNVEILIIQWFSSFI